MQLYILPAKVAENCERIKPGLSDDSLNNRGLRFWQNYCSIGLYVPYEMPTTNKANMNRSALRMSKDECSLVTI